MPRLVKGNRAVGAQLGHVKDAFYRYLRVIHDSSNEELFLLRKAKEALFAQIMSDFGLHTEWAVAGYARNRADWEISKEAVLLLNHFSALVCEAENAITKSRREAARAS